MRQTFCGNRGGNRWRTVPKPKRLDAFCQVCGDQLCIDTDRITGEEMGLCYCPSCDHHVRTADGRVPAPYRHDPDDLPF